MAEVHKAVLAIIEDIGFIGKDKEMKEGARYKYRGIEQVLSALQPLLVKHHVVIEPRVVAKEYEEKESRNGGGLVLARLTVDYRFVHAVDDSSMLVTFAGEAMDSSDKATSKAQSVAYKNMCFLTFCIPTEEGEKEDQDRERPEFKATVERGTRESTGPVRERTEPKKQSYTEQKPKEDIVTADQWTAMRSTARTNGWPPAEISKFIAENKQAGKKDIEVYNIGMLFFARPWLNPDEIKGDAQ